jgi:hypothetical protein
MKDGPRKLLALGCMSLGAGTFILLLFLLAAMGAFQTMPASPFEEEDICFMEEHPGATGRFTVYTPVRCSERTKQLGPGVGADHATLDFQDTDGDEVPEVIIASSPLRCRFGTGPCYDAWRIVMKLCPGCDTPFTIVERTYLEELTPEGQVE